MAPQFNLNKNERKFATVKDTLQNQQYFSNCILKLDPPPLPGSNLMP